MNPTTRPDGPPTRCDLLITGAAVLDPTGNDPDALTHRRSIAIAGDTIIEVGPSDDLDARYDSLRTISATGHVVTPGFVDAHVHLGAFLGAARPYTRPSKPSPYGGAGDERTALRTVAQLCSMPVPDDLVATVVKPVLAAMVRCGFTAVVDAGGPGPGGVFAAAELLGIRAAVGPSFADRWHDESGVLDTRADTDQLLADAAAFLHSHTDRTPTVVPVASAVETLGCSDALLGFGVAAPRAVPGLLEGDGFEVDALGLEGRYAVCDDDAVVARHRGRCDHGEVGVDEFGDGREVLGDTGRAQGRVR